MATIVKTPSGTWKAVIRKLGWPTTAKTFRTKRDAEDWARSTEDEMVRGVYLSRAPSERLTVAGALMAARLLRLHGFLLLHANRHHHARDGEGLSLSTTLPQGASTQSVTITSNVAISTRCRGAALPSW
jgi:hypothetical protein